MTKRNSRRGPLLMLGIVFAVVVATLLLDALVFGRLVFAPANRTSWDSFPWYNFETQYRRLLRERADVPDDHDYVLIVGSSIAKYSVQKRELEAALREAAGDRGRSVTVEIFSHAAMLPTDLAFYVERIRALRPDLVVYLTGPADLDLERYAAPYEIVGAGSGERPGYDNDAAKTFIANRHPMRVFYPRGFARYAVERLDLDLEQILRLSFRQSFYALRFEDAWWDPLVFNLKTGAFQNPGAPVVSYLNYQGVVIPEGLWREGHSISQFTFALRDQRAASTGSTAALATGQVDRIRLQIPGALAGVSGFHLKIFTTRPGRSAHAERRAIRFTPSRGGWQDVALPPELAAIDLSSKNAADVWITIQLSHVLASVPSPGAPPVLAVREAALLPGDGGFPTAAVLNSNQDRTATADQDPSALARRLTIGRGLRLTIGRGLRLPGNFGRDRLPVDQAYLRRPAWEDWRLEAMNEAEYSRDFAARIEPENWREPRHLAFRQLNQIRLAKYNTNWYEFRPHIQQVRDLERFARALIAGAEARPCVDRSQQNQARGACGGAVYREGQSEASKPRLLIINNPENPLTLAAYEDNAWYRGYVAHLRRLTENEIRAPDDGGSTPGSAAGSGPSRGVYFADHRRRLPANLFLDTHHLTYGGLRAMAPVYAAEIERVLAD